MSLQERLNLLAAMTTEKDNFQKTDQRYSQRVLTANKLGSV